jgi:hypothetical protein
VIRLNALNFENLQVESEKNIKWRYTGEHLFVTFIDGLEKNEKMNISIKYRVNSPTLGILYGGPTKEYPNEAYYFASDNETGNKKKEKKRKEKKMLKMIFENLLQKNQDIGFQVLVKILLKNGVLCKKIGNTLYNNNPLI